MNNPDALVAAVDVFDGAFRDQDHARTVAALTGILEELEGWQDDSDRGLRLKAAGLVLTGTLCLCSSDLAARAALARRAVRLQMQLED